MTLTEENSAVLQDLLRRVESATGADRELDEAIWGLVLPGVTLTYDRCNFTASLDAALALVERVLPGWSWGVSGALGPICDGMLYAPSETGYRLKIRCKAATPPLALLAALLKALIAEQAAGQTPESPQ